MDVPHAPHVRAPDRHRRPGRVAAQQPRCEHGRLQEQHGCRGHGASPQQLRGQERPLRVGIAAGGVHAREAGPLPGDDEGADGHPVAGELDGQVHDVLRDEGGGPTRVDESVGDDEDGGPGPLQRPPGHRRHVDAGCDERADEGRLLAGRQIGGQLHGSAGIGGGAGHERVRDACDEVGGLRR